MSQFTFFFSVAMFAQIFSHALEKWVTLGWNSHELRWPSYPVTTRGNHQESSASRRTCFAFANPSPSFFFHVAIFIFSFPFFFLSIFLFILPPFPRIKTVIKNDQTGEKKKKTLQDLDQKIQEISKMY